MSPQALPNAATTTHVDALSGFSMTWNDKLATHGPSNIGFQTLTLTTNKGGAVTG
jgi:hypothetical protein